MHEVGWLVPKFDRIATQSQTQGSPICQYLPEKLVSARFLARQGLALLNLQLKKMAWEVSPLPSSQVKKLTAMTCPVCNQNIFGTDSVRKCCWPNF